MSFLVPNNLARAGQQSLPKSQVGKPRTENVKDCIQRHPDAQCKEKRGKEGLGLPLDCFEILFKGKILYIHKCHEWHL